MLQELRAWAVVLFTAGSLTAAAVTVQFQPRNPGAGPFPTNALTQPDSAQATGTKVALPFPSACAGDPSLSVCSDTALLNQLDGFSINPRIRVCFSGPIQEQTALGGIYFRPASSGSSVGITQGVWDPSSNCLFAKPTRPLDEQTRYLLLIDRTVRDAGGKKINRSREFKDCLKHNSPDPYCQDLQQALGDQGQDDESEAPGSLAGASLFTTMSVTDWVRKARGVVQGIAPNVMIDGRVAIADLQSATWVQDLGNGNTQNVPLPFDQLQGVKEIVFGSFESPNFLTNPPFGSIALYNTAGPIPPPLINTRIYFHAFIPQEPASGGYGAVVYGHGMTDSRFGAPTAVASTMAQSGLALITFNAVGHGFGPAGRVEIQTTGGQRIVLPAPGRGRDIAPPPGIDSTEGCIQPGAYGVRDCFRQTAVDATQAIHALRGQLGIDSSRVFFLGQSLGSFYGTITAAVEPNLKAVAFNGGGATTLDVVRLAAQRDLAVFYLGSRNPPLLNRFPPPDFHEDYPLPGRPVKVITDPSALAIQAAFEVAEWFGMPGDPLGYARYVEAQPVSGSPAKPTLFQFAWGDAEVPNPVNLRVYQAASIPRQPVLFRADRALRAFGEPGIQFSAHRFMTSFFDPITGQASAAQAAIALAAQRQIAGFFTSGGTNVADANQFLPPGFPQLFTRELPPNDLTYCEFFGGAPTACQSR